VIAAYLRDCGYRVIEAANADEAREVLGRGLARIGVVLADIRAPNREGAVEPHGADDRNGNGFGLARWIRERHPGVAVILAGSPARAAEAAGDLCQKGPMLAKPYEPQVVVDRIRRLLARRPPPSPPPPSPPPSR
jgi:DNA-binding response OmpR family regulator